MALNSFRYDNSKNRSKSRQATDANFLAYDERCIITAAIDKVRTIDSSVKMYRRHDSFLCFELISYSCLNDFEYLGQGGWFDSYTPPEDLF